MDNIQCSVCEQYAIDKVKIKKDGEILYICEECDTVWKCEESIGNTNEGEDFGKYMIKKGLSPYWDEIKIIEEYI
ncbi:hypothetical protein FDB54_10395 [Clostridium botulinum]|nr:hypothetical protein [Clostridium botulinum]